MKKRNRIILLVDLSQYAENLVDFAFRISEVIGAKVVLVHQIVAFAPAMADQETRNAITAAEKEEAYARLHELVRGKVYSSDDLQVSSKPILTILKELAHDSFFDWVIAGLKGTGSLKRLFIGSTTTSIIDESNLLTIAVPARNFVALPEKLMVGVHPKYPLNRKQMDNVLSSLQQQIKSVKFFTVLKEGEDGARAKNHLIRLQNEYRKYHPERELYQGIPALHLLKEKVELSENTFLMVQQGARMITDRMFRKFTINELIYNGQMPLIVLSK